MDLTVLSLALPWIFAVVLVAIMVRVARLFFKWNNEMLVRLDYMEQQIKALRDIIAPKDESEYEGLKIGEPAPPIRLPDLNGKMVSLEQYRGKRVLLMFFGSDCAWCERMAPLVALLPVNGGNGRPVPFIVSWGTADENRMFSTKYRIKCPILPMQDEDGIDKAYQMTGTPEAYLIDEEGKIASKLMSGAKDILALAEPQEGGTNGNGHEAMIAAGNGHVHEEA